MIWHLKTVKVDTPREADIGMEHLCSVGKCSIGETCNLIFEVLEPYEITRFQRLPALPFFYTFVLKY